MLRDSSVLQVGFGWTLLGLVPTLEDVPYNPTPVREPLTHSSTGGIVSKKSPKMFEKYSPVTGELLGSYPITSTKDVNAAVARARAAFPAWRDLGIKQRQKKLDRLKDIIARDGEEFAARISKDTGKPLVDSMMTELFAIPLFLDYYRKTAPKLLARKRVRTPIVFPGKTSYIEYFPMGIVGVISPWNFPFQLSMVPAISALLAGNTVVLKPSEVTPITGELIAELMARVGLPEGVFQVIQGDGTTGAALSKADIDKLFFTGSVATGKKVMKAAAEKPIPVELELGGKDAMIVCEDANLERAARGAIWGGLINCGQMCTSVERIFVHAEIYDRFIALLEREVDKVKVGGPDDEADVGPLTFAKQMETVEAHVKGAVEDGADLRRGGYKIEGKGQFYAPALITDVTPDMEIYKEETFGPVLPVIKVKSDAEAIRLANDHQYGLTGSVWTQDRERGLRIASAMECGQVMVNDVVISVGNPVLPFGGVKSSGFGRYHGPEGLLSFVHQKAIMADRGLLNGEPLWFPYAGKYEHVTKVFEGLLNNNMVKAVGNLIRMR